jgi:syntaxin-binding protein 1
VEQNPRRFQGQEQASVSESAPVLHIKGRPVLPTYSPRSTGVFGSQNLVRVQVPDSLFEQIKGAPILLARVGNFVELNMEFLCLEPQVFTLNMQRGFIDAGPGMLAPSEAPIEQQTTERACVATIATRLLTFCSTMGEFPNIRYQRGTTVAAKVAKQMKELMEQRAGSTPESPAAGSSTIVILDRTHDPLAPLLSEFYVQGCATDTLKLENHTFKYNGKDVLLNDEDTVWRDMCHVFVGEAQDTIHKRQAELERRPAYKMLQAQKSGQQMDIKGMSDVVKDLPKFKKEYERCQVSVDVLIKMMAIAAKLIPAVEVQQALAVERINKDRQEEFRHLLSDPAIYDNGKALPEIEKLRLIMLYAITQFSGAKAMPADLRTSLMQMAGLDDQNYQNALAAAMLVGRDYAENHFVLARKSSKKKASDDDLTLARYTPLVKDVASALVTGSLPLDHYPSMRDADVPAAGSGSGPKVGAGKSVRGAAGGGRTAPRWASKSKGAGGGGGGAGGSDEKTPKIIIFVIGGMTHSEMRSVYEATKEQQKAPAIPVLIGSTSLLHPSISYDANGVKKGGTFIGCPEFISNCIDVWTPSKA